MPTLGEDWEPVQDWGEVLEPGYKYSTTVVVDGAYPRDFFDLSRFQPYVPGTRGLTPQGFTYRTYPVLIPDRRTPDKAGYSLTLIATCESNPEGVTGQRLVDDAVKLSRDPPFTQEKRQDATLVLEWLRRRRIVTDLTRMQLWVKDEEAVPDPDWLRDRLRGFFAGLGEALKYLVGGLGVLGVAWLWHKFRDHD